MRRATRLRLLHPAHQPISIHALREEGDWFWFCCEWRRRHFYLHPPRGGRRGGVQPDRRPRRISIHALREEGDGRQQPIFVGVAKFLSTPSARRATISLRESRLPPWISIHALREEGDATVCASCCRSALFLSTPSARRATFDTWEDARRFAISIHALREEGDSVPHRQKPKDNISIHALREEGDLDAEKRGVRQSHFYPRPPRGGRLVVHIPLGDFLDISIHALREEGDGTPRSQSRVFLVFLSTPSARRATARLHSEHG